MRTIVYVGAESGDRRKQTPSHGAVTPLNRLRSSRTLALDAPRDQPSARQSRRHTTVQTVQTTLTHRPGCSVWPDPSTRAKACFVNSSSRRHTPHRTTTRLHQRPRTHPIARLSTPPCSPNVLSPAPRSAWPLPAPLPAPAAAPTAPSPPRRLPEPRTTSSTASVPALEPTRRSLVSFGASCRFSKSTTIGDSARDAEVENTGVECEVDCSRGFTRTSTFGTSGTKSASGQLLTKVQRRGPLHHHCQRQR